MTGASPGSNTPDLDGSTIPARVVHNVFVDMVHKLDTELWHREGRMPSRHEMISFVENIKYEIYRKAKLFVPAPVKAAKKAAADAPDSRAEYYARKAGRPSGS